jgi:hypothetical protein
MDLTNGPLEYADRRLSIARAVTQLDLVYQAMKANEVRARAVAKEHTRDELYLRVNRWYGMIVSTTLYEDQPVTDPATLNIYEPSVRGSAERHCVIIGPGFSFAAVFSDTRSDGEAHMASPSDMASGRGYGVDFTEYTAKAKAAYNFIANNIYPGVLTRTLLARIL